MTVGRPLERSVAPTPGPARSFRFTDFQRRELSAGVELLVAPMRDRPLVYLELISAGGARFDPRGLAGLAAQTGALLDEGVPGKDSRQIAAAAERIGGYLATHTDWDTLSIASGLLSVHTETGLALLAEILGSPTLPEAELERLRDRSLAELRRRRVLPGSLAARQFSRAIFGNTTFGQPIVGTEESIARIRQSDTRAFYDRHIVAAPLVVIAVGDVDPDRLAGEARRLLDGLPRVVRASTPVESAADTADISASHPTSEGTRVIVVDRPEGTQTELRVGHLGIARSDPDFTALAVMNSILGGKFTSRLNLNLRERHGFTYGVRSGFSARKSRGSFAVSTAVATESAGQAVHEIRSELERLRDEPVAPEELDETLSYLLGVFPYTVQTLEGVAHRLHELALHDFPDDHWDRYAERLEAVTIAELQRVAREHLSPDALTIVAVGPEGELSPQLEKFGEVEIWRPSQRPEPL